jgi:hypothetical protein
MARAVERRGLGAATPAKVLVLALVVIALASLEVSLGIVAAAGGLGWMVLTGDQNQSQLTAVQRTASDLSSRLELTLEHQPEVASGDPVAFTLRLRNVGEGMARATLEQAESTMTIRNAQGVVIWTSSEVIQLPEGVWFRLGEGEEKRFEHEWSGLEASGQRAFGGTYTVQASVQYSVAKTDGNRTYRALGDVFSESRELRVVI